MSSNLIETIRGIHGEVERDTKAILAEISSPRSNYKKYILQVYKIKARLERIKNNQLTLLKFYEDKKETIDKAASEIQSKNSLGVFYGKVNEILMKKKILKSESNFIDKSADSSLNFELNFSGEEFYGKYVEMNSQYQEFLNIKGMPSMYLNGIKKIDYKLYLEVLDHFHNIPQKSKNSNAYFAYCKNVKDYLVSFYKRKYPMNPIQKILNEIEEEFEQKWSSDNVFGWQKEWPIEIFQKYPSKSSLSLEERKNLLDKSEKKKEKIKQRFCEPCGRNFKETVWEGHLKGKRHRKNSEKIQNNTQNQDQVKDTKDETKSIFNKDLQKTKSPIIKGKKFEREKETAKLEFCIKIFKTLLADVFEETCYYIEKKLTRSFTEIQKELEKREADEDQEEEAMEEGPESLWSGGVYNPKKVPLGWDGRPIPYWLYKFHGLNIGYKCEICGGNKYYGPRAFQQHFKEWKHANGMKALGLPNTKHFHFVTKIEEAKALYERLKERKLIEMFNPQLEEEFEDHEGNVYGKQTYEALKRQRVI